MWAPRRELLYRRGDLVLVMLAIDEYSPFDEVPGIVISDTPKTYSFAEVFYNGCKKFIHVERTTRYVK